MTEFNWANASPAARRAHWVTALRSGGYQQTTGWLQTDRGFCCLGVLCDLVDKSRWREGACDIRSFVFDGNPQDTMPPIEILNQVGITEPEAGSLASANDRCESFGEIADRIERGDYFYDEYASATEAA